MLSTRALRVAWPSSLRSKSSPVYVMSLPINVAVKIAVERILGRGESRRQKWCCDHFGGIDTYVLLPAVFAYSLLLLPLIYDVVVPTLLTFKTQGGAAL